jgi:hypothetical protein
LPLAVQIYAGNNRFIWNTTIAVGGIATLQTFWLFGVRAEKQWKSRMIRTLNCSKTRGASPSLMNSWLSTGTVSEPRLANAGLVLRYRRVNVSAMARERIRRAFSSTSVLPLRAFTEGRVTAIQNVLLLVMEGTVHIDWWENLTLAPK